MADMTYRLSLWQDHQSYSEVSCRRRVGLETVTSREQSTRRREFALQFLFHPTPSLQPRREPSCPSGLSTSPGSSSHTHRCLHRRSARAGRLRGTSLLWDRSRASSSDAVRIRIGTTGRGSAGRWGYRWWFALRRRGGIWRSKFWWLGSWSQPGSQGSRPQRVYYSRRIGKDRPWHTEDSIQIEDLLHSLTRA